MITDQQYSDDSNLSIRLRTHALYTEPKLDFHNWVLDLVEWTGNERVLDVGCGAGSYLQSVKTRAKQVFAGDFSFGMLGSIPPDFDRISLDAHELCFGRNSAELILANHMIYHLHTPQKAIAEFARVLVPTGKLIAATNSDNNMSGMYTLIQTAVEKCGSTERIQSPLRGQFSLENGTETLSHHFSHIQAHILDAALVFPTAQPLLDYISSLSTIFSSPDGKFFGIDWHTVQTTLRNLIEAKIATDGEYRIAKQSGAFICSNTEQIIQSS